MEIGATRLSFAQDCKGFASGLVAFDEDSQRVAVADSAVDSVLNSALDSVLEFIRLTSPESLVISLVTRQ